MQRPKAEPGDICPLNQKPVEKVCHKCPLYVQLRGSNPNTGDPVDTWGCSLAFLPMLLIENAQQVRQSGAAIESFRNEMVTQNNAAARAIGQAVARANPKLIEN